MFALFVPDQSVWHDVIKLIQDEKELEIASAVLAIGYGAGALHMNLFIRDKFRGVQARVDVLASRLSRAYDALDATAKRAENNSRRIDELLKEQDEATKATNAAIKKEGTAETTSEATGEVMDGFVITAVKSIFWFRQEKSSRRRTDKRRLPAPAPRL